MGVLAFALCVVVAVAYGWSHADEPPPPVCEQIDARPSVETVTSVEGVALLAAPRPDAEPVTTLDLDDTFVLRGFAQCEAGVPDYLRVSIPGEGAEDLFIPMVDGTTVG